ncbi:disease resistance protein RPV1-like isoform X3 [Diospyros lotus]|uniref:disease resistance protein RPV1-like isoform X3 n=1 Tax=Diospyros lotus TaxID=55363 RepID=UPI00225AC4E5|nr:disease resistance protein RPV1-like isoform X3 [Diospyros lotus]
MGASQSTSSSSTTTTTHEGKFDVFISFRGEDTRDNIKSHLYQALSHHHIETFVDDKLVRGDEISPALLKAIEESKISVVVFSKDYASSKWCLRELAEIMKYQRLNMQVVIPVFYHVNPSDVRKQSGTFKDSFAKHNKQVSKQEVQSWRDALTEAANLSGWDTSATKPEATLVEEIVKDVIKKLNAISPLSCDLNGLVGIDSRIKKVKLMLGIGELDFRIVGIWGMGGIGKTTLADAVFGQVCTEFEGCCFIGNVREESEKCGGLARLQEEFLSKLLGGENMKFRTPNVPEFVRRRLKSMKVLVVLDDMTKLKQLEVLAGGIEEFGPGSRVVITSRDKQLLSNCGCGSRDIYEVEALNNQNALQLFCKHAFNQDHSPEELLEFAEKVVEYAKGNPLVLKELGSSFYQKTTRECESAVHKFKRIPIPEIRNLLRVSYDGLGPEEKEIFLDIAFFLKGMDRNYVTKILDDCYSSARFGISVLVDKSLITISKTNEIEMDDLLQEMGWDIVCEESSSFPGKRSRLNNHEDVRNILNRNTGTDTIKGIVLDMSETKDIALNSEAFEKLYNLKFLKFYYQTQCSGHSMSASKVHVPHSLNYLPDELRSLHWHGYPLKTLPTEFSLEYLVELNLPYSNLEQLWEEVKDAPCLKLLTLSHSQNLTSLPDLSHLPCLEVMNLEDCRSLSEIPISIQHLHHLNFLCLKGCESLRSIPSSICSLTSLFHLDLSNCSKLDKLPENLRDLVCLKYLFLNHCGLKEIPEDIGCLSSLELLELCGNKFDSLPTSIEQLSELRRLLLNNCSMLQSLTLPSGLQSLEAMNCKQLQLLPDTSELSGVITKRFIKEYERAFPVSICLPGSVIPDWFNHQKIGSSIMIPLPTDTSKLVGFALCTVIAFENYSDDGRGVRVSFKSHYSDTTDFCGSLTVCDTQRHNHARSMYSDHVVQGYYPFSNVAGFLSVEFCPQNFDGQPLEGCKVKNCAVCPVYAEEPIETRSSDETDTSGSESGRLDVEEMDPHPKITGESKSTLLIDEKVDPFYQSLCNRVGWFLSFIFCLFCGVFVFGLLVFLLLHLSTHCEVYLSSHAQNMRIRRI